MPIRRLDDRQTWLPFSKKYLTIAVNLLSAPRPKKPIPVIEKIVYKTDETASMLADGHAARGDSYRTLTLKVLKFTKRLLADAGNVMEFAVHQEYDLDLELLEDELEELTETFDRKESRSHKEQEKELAKKRQMSPRKPSGSSLAHRRPF